MVNAVYDHVVAIVVVGLMFVGAVVVVPTMSFMNLQAIDQQLLRNTALNVFNTVLLDTGQPIDWGSIRYFTTNDPRVKRFGLAGAEESTLYVLDPDKVQRLVKGNPLGEMTYARVKQLLGLQGYGFSLKIIPPFIVTFSSKDISVVGNSLRYKAQVSYLDGRPIPNAEVYSTVVYTKGKDYFNISQSGPVQTNALGICNGTATLDAQGSPPDYYMVTLRVNVADVATLIVTSGQPFNNTIARINIVYDTVVLTSWKDPPNYNYKPNENVRIIDIVAFDSQGTLWYLFHGDKGEGNDNMFNTGDGSFERWSEVFRGLHDSDPVIMIFNFWAVDQGRSYVLVTVAYPNLLGSSVFEYGGYTSSASSAVRIQRSVQISGMTFTAELWLWKESP